MREREKNKKLGRKKYFLVDFHYFIQTFGGGGVLGGER